MQIVLRGEIECMREKITCEEWKIWGILKGTKKLRRKKQVNGKNKRLKS